MTGQQIPLNLSVAPFPEGFQGDMDETWQQGVQLMEAFIEGNFLTGLILPPGSTLPTSDQGPIAMGNQWYFWDPATGQYLPQTVSAKMAKNFAKNSVYQVHQTGSIFNPVGAGIINTYDMVLTRSTLGSVLAIAADTGPPASVDNDNCPAAIRYTVGPALVPTPGAADLYVHEHLIEGADIAMLQGEVLSLSVSVWVNQPGVYSVYLTSGGRDVSYVANFTATTANAWIRVKIAGIPPLPTGIGTWNNFSEGVTSLYIGVAMLVGTQWQQAPANLNGWHAGFWAGSASNINMCTVVGNQIKISGIKLEASPQVSYLSVPSFDTDFWEALRYYYTTFSYQSTTAGIAVNLGAPANGQWSAAMLFPRRMAKVPTVVPFGYSSHAVGQITDISAASVDVPVATLAATQKGICDSQNAVISTTGNLTSATLTGTLTLNSTVITAISSTAGLISGLTVSGAGLLAGTLIDTVTSSTVIAVSKPAVGAGTGVTLTFGTFTITGIPSTTGMRVGQPISGTGIPPGTTITSVGGTSISISAAVTAFGTGVALTIGLVSKADVLWSLITADARLT